MQSGTEHTGRISLSLLKLAVVVMLCSRTGHAILPAGTLQQQTLEAVSRYLKLEDGDPLARTLQVLPPFSFLPAGASLRVVSVKPAFSPGMWLVRLECAPRSGCLPFYAAFRGPEPGLASVPQFAGQVSSPAAGRASPHQAANHPLARSGEQVEVIEEVSGMRLKAKAVCLQSGSLGELIRVRNVGTNRILLATVAGEHLVRVER